MVEINYTKILSETGEKIDTLSTSLIQKLSEYGATPTPLLSKLFSVFIAAGLIYGGTKIGQKLAKWAMFVVGILILGVVGYSFFV